MLTFQLTSVQYRPSPLFDGNEVFGDNVYGYYTCQAMLELNSPEGSVKLVWRNLKPIYHRQSILFYRADRVETDQLIL